MIPAQSRTARPLDKTRHLSGKRRGFALVLALGMMAFVLVLILGLATLVQVESSSASQTLALKKARENARLSAMIALGELQKQMGPDTRVSARAEIFADGLTEDPPDTGVAPFNAAEATRFWTGAWRGDDWDPARSTDREDRFLGWLVSMPPVDRDRIDSAASPPFNPLDPAEAVPLAVLPSQANDGTDFTLRAPLQRLSDESGAYAWWVSDEGVKASVNLSDPFAGERQPPLSDDLPRYLFPHRPNFAATEWFADTSWESSELLERRLRANPQTGWALLFPDPDEISAEAEAALEHPLQGDFTAHSFGVLSDSRQGGLKGDLSLALWRDPAEWRALGTGAAFEPNAGFEADFRNHRIFNKEDYPHAEQSIRSSGALAFFGPRWEVLRDYHNSFQKLVDPDDPDTAVRMILPGLSDALYDLPRSRSIPSWDDQYRRGRIILPTIIGGRESTDQDPIQDGGTAATPGNQILAIDSRSEGFEPVESTTSGLYPLMQRASIFFNLDMRELPDPDFPDDSSKTVYAPRINAFSIIHYWNPHNVTLTSRDPVTGRSGGGWSMDLVSKLNFTIERLDSNGNLIEKADFRYDHLRNSEIYAANPGYDYFIGRTEFNTEPGNDSFFFRPGEIRAFLLDDTTSSDEADGVLAGIMEPFFASPRVFIPYEKTGPTVPWGPNPNRRTTDPILFEENDQLRITLAHAPSGTGFNLHSSGSISRNGSFTQGFRWVDIPDAAPFIDIIPDVTTLVGNPVELGGLEMRMKAADTAPGENPSRVLANFNPRAIYAHTQMGDYAQGQPPNYRIRFLAGDPFDTTAWNFEDVGGRTLLRGFWGSSDGAAGQNFVSLFDSPRRPPESIGQYQHAHLAIYPHQPAYPLGNSLADPHVRRDVVIDRQNGKTQMDLSWLLNDSLWDGYFLSTIDPDNPVDGRSAPQRDRFLEIDATRTYATDEAEGYRRVAENLLLRGAFNVNSTSVEAWATQLGALSGEGIRFFNTIANADALTAPLDFPFFRQSVPSGDADTAWLGGPRDLSRTEIRRLAEAMVREVRRRGPFLNLSDFVNRRLVNDERGLKGALQAAIDAANLQSVDVGGNSLGGGDLGAPFAAHASGRQAEFAPGRLSQADVLTTLGPSICTRSDSFVIRAYGAAENPVTGAPEAQAWCEMRVQRIPRTHDDAEFGRPFKVLSFRWLQESEI